MNCQDCKEHLVEYIEELLEDQQAGAIESHLADCPGCRAEAARMTDLRKRLFENGQTFAQTDLENAVFDRIVRRQHLKLKEIRKIDRQFNLWRIIMKSKITKLAAAAVIIIAVLFGMNIVGNGGNVAWGQVLEKVEQFGTYVYKHRMSITDLSNLPEGQQECCPPEVTVQQDSKVYISSEYGMRAEKDVGGELTVIEYMSPSDNGLVQVLVKLKQYARGRLTEEQVREILQKSDPKEIVKEFMSFEYRELGHDTIEGVKVEGIEVDDPKFGAPTFESAVGRLWVSVESNLPVKAEIEGVSSGGKIRTKIEASEFEWDPELKPEIFVPDIPADYELIADIELDSEDEDKLVKGLRDFAELTGGRYPSSLTLMTANQEAGLALLVKRRMKGIARNVQPSKEEIEKVVSIQNSCLFYAELVKEKEPAYYGDKVTTEFSHAVLLSWKLAEDQYRVLFGDLTFETVSAERLDELESMPLNLEPQAIKPQPQDGTVGTVVSGLELVWMSGADAISHQVYFGTDIEELAPVGEVEGETFTDLPELERDTIYYWRVDEVQPDGLVIVGDVWSFSTGYLVGWWKFDEDSGDTAVDSSGNGFDGLLVGQTQRVDGVSGGALNFDGDDDYVDIGKGPEFDITEQITLMAWIQVNVFDQQWQGIVTKGDTSWRLSRGGGDNGHFACTGFWPEWLNGKVSLDDGKWHHVAGVYDGMKLYLYIDGALDISQETSGRISVNDSPVHIGSNSEKEGFLWNGMIDDVRIYSYALNADEVAAIYASAIVTSAD